MWIWIISVYFFLNKGSRKSIIDMVFSKNTFQLLFPVITYNFLIIYFLHVYWFWNISFFKDSLYWIFWYSLVIFFRINEVDKWIRFLSKMIFWTFSIVAVIAFVGNLYPLSFFGELILQPVLIFLALISSLGWIFTKKIPRYSEVAKFFEIVLLWLGAFFLFRLFFIVLYEYEKIFILKNLYFFLYPMVLSIFYVPFLYLLRLMTNYESLFIRINPANWWWSRNALYIKYGIVKYCHFNLNKLNKFSEFFGRHYFLQEKPDIDVLISNFNKQF